MRLRTIGFISILALGLLAGPLPAEAQKAGKVYRIGFLTRGSVEGFKLRLAAFRQGLQELEYLEVKNIVIEERYAEGRRKRLPANWSASRSTSLSYTGGQRPGLRTRRAGRSPLSLRCKRILSGPGWSPAWRGRGETSRGFQTFTAT